ncbi:unnamed protein product [Closterium sp. NIES-54]
MRGVVGRRLWRRPRASPVADTTSGTGESTKSDVVEVQPEPRKSDRVRRPPDFFVPAAFTTVYDVDDDDDLLYDDAEEDEEFPELDPNMLADPEHRRDISTMTVKEALASWKGPAVKAAMEEEIRSLINMGTWELVERPPGVNIMKNRWVLTTKYHVDDTVEREKARLVVKGFTQVYGADYDETFAPVGSYVTLRIFLSIAAVLNLNLMQLDMKNAFLQSKLDRSPLLWYLALNDVLVGAKWRKSQIDEALYFKVGKDGVACWVLVYVDDLLATSSSTEMLKELKELLESAFELREISPVQKYLGLEIVRDRSAGKLWLHQQGYADKLRRRFIDEEQTGRTPKTPVSVDAYAELTFDDEEAQEQQEEVYRQKVGSLQFAATTTRPDVAFACSKLGSGLTLRSDQHWREVDRCLAYLANTRDTALEFSGGPESLELVGYVDADDAGDKQNRTSTGGYVFVYGGATVSWSSQRIKCVTLSSTESEYAAATEAGKEGRRLCFLLAEFQQLDAGKPTILRVDNKSAITVAEGMGLTCNLKHMERRQAWLQHMVKRGKFSLSYIPTAKQPADFLTKVLHYPAFNRCSVAIGQKSLSFPPTPSHASHSPQWGRGRAGASAEDAIVLMHSLMLFHTFPWPIHPMLLVRTSGEEAELPRLQVVRPVIHSPIRQFPRPNNPICASRAYQWSRGRATAPAREEATPANSDGKQQQQQQRWRLSCELLPRRASATTPCTQPDAQCAAVATPCTQPDALGAAAATPCTQPDALGAAAATPCTQPDAPGAAAGATPCTQPDLSHYSPSPIPLLSPASIRPLAPLPIPRFFLLPSVALTLVCSMAFPLAPMPQWDILLCPTLGFTPSHSPSPLVHCYLSPLSFPHYSSCPSLYFLLAHPSLSYSSFPPSPPVCPSLSSLPIPPFPSCPSFPLPLSFPLFPPCPSLPFPFVLPSLSPCPSLYFLLAYPSLSQLSFPPSPLVLPSISSLLIPPFPFVAFSFSPCPSL